MVETRTPNADRPRVVILGAGFAGLWAARHLGRSEAEVLVLDRNNYHTFFPLLYQVAAAELEPEEIVNPVRSILRGRKNVQFLMEEVREVDLDNRLVSSVQRDFPYDYLILAIGSTPNFYGVEGAEEHAFQLKSLEQAIDIRNHILFRFEMALCEPDPDIRKQMLTFAVVGGGPTGVEFAGALIELVNGPLKKDYPELDFGAMHVVLLEAMDHLLTGMPERLQNYALQRLQKMGVEVCLQATVSQVTASEVCLKDGTSIPTETVIWTAGVKGGGVKYCGGLPVARNGQIDVLPTLQIQGHPEVYVTGDLARGAEGERNLGMVAQVALQEGTHAARNITLQMQGQEPSPFHYRDLGTLAVIGRNSAVASIGGLGFTGLIAWFLWLGVHIFNLIGFRNRLLVLINWAWAYLFYDRAVRLIVTTPEAPAEKQAEKLSEKV